MIFSCLYFTTKRALCKQFFSKKRKIFCKYIKERTKRRDLRCFVRYSCDYFFRETANLAFAAMFSAVRP